jgi:hypothetical protein
MIVEKMLLGVIRTGGLMGADEAAVASVDKETRTRAIWQLAFLRMQREFPLI